MAKTVDQRVNEAFSKDSTVDAKEFADKILDSWKDVSASLSKTAILFLVLIAIFELLVYQRSSTSFTIGTFTIASTSIVKISLPTIIAYVTYDGYRLTARWNNLESAYCAIAKIYAPQINESGLDLLIKPPLPSVWGIGWALPDASREDAFIDAIRGVLAVIAILLLPLGFEIQAYYVLFGLYGYQNIALWFSAVFTAALIASIFIFIVLAANSVDSGKTSPRDNLQGVQ